MNSVNSISSTIILKRHPVVLRIALLAVLLIGCARIAQAASDQRVDALFETALSSYRLERWEDAAKQFYDFMAAAPHDPRNDQAQFCAARSYMHRRYLNKAIEEFTYLIEDFPDSPYTSLGIFDRSNSYLETRQPDKALDDRERLIAIKVRIYHGDEDAMLRQLYENHRASVFWLAEHYKKANQPEKEIAAYQKLPYQMEAFRNVVEVYYRLGQFDTIRELIDGLQAENRHEGFKFLIEFYGRRKAINQLKNIFSVLLQEKDPNNHTDDLVWTTVWSFDKVGQEHWEWAMRRVSQYYPRMAQRADYELAKRFWNRNEFFDELELFVIKYRQGSDVNQVLRWKGIMLERRGLPDEARTEYKRITDAGLGHWFICGSYHGSHAREKDLEGACKEYERMRIAFHSQELSALAQWTLGELYQGNKQYEEAVEAFRHVATRFADVSVEKWRYGNIYEHDYRIWIEKREYGPDAQLRLADILREIKQYEDAILEYRVVISKWPRSEQASWAAFRTGLCYEGLLDHETAIRVYKSVLRRYAKSRAAGDAHTRLEVRYDIPDLEVADTVDFFDTVDEREKDRVDQAEILP